MSRTPLIAGNWKMNTLREEALALVHDLRARVDGVQGVEKLVCPPYLYLHAVREALAGSTISVGAQDMYWEEKGAFTGQISPNQIAEACEYVIIGHSERRQFFGETDETVNRRVKAALAHGLKPIMCVGELLDERQANKTSDVLVRQTRAGLEGVDVSADFVIAYEPVWAIGTGLAADGPTAQEAIALIRSTARDVAGGVIDSVRMLYGGSATPDNIEEFMRQPDIDGGLVGGASLKADVFGAIIEKTAALRGVMDRRVVAIVGATATGKTALGVALAQRLGGEIINADSRQVYRGMDIGTAKPTAEERALAPHHLLDIANPAETVTLARWLDEAKPALDDVWARNRLPIVVGGTGQYIWALLEGWRVPRVPPDPDLRARLQAEERERPGALIELLQSEDAASAASIDPHNHRRLMRAIEVTRATGQPFSEWQRKDSPPFASTVLGLHLDRPALYARIDARADTMFASGLIDEVRGLNAAGHGCELPPLSGIGYRQVCQYLAGDLSLADAIARTKTQTHRLARMQHAWFKPADERIHWLQADAEGLFERTLKRLALPADP